MKHATQSVFIAALLTAAKAGDEASAEEWVQTMRHACSATEGRSAVKRCRLQQHGRAAQPSNTVPSAATRMGVETTRSHTDTYRFYVKSLKNDANGLTKYRLTDLKTMVISGE